MSPRSPCAHRRARSTCSFVGYGGAYQEGVGERVSQPLQAPISPGGCNTIAALFAPLRKTVPRLYGYLGARSAPTRPRGCTHPEPGLHALVFRLSTPDYTAVEEMTVDLNTAEELTVRYCQLSVRRTSLGRIRWFPDQSGARHLTPSKEGAGSQYPIVGWAQQMPSDAEEIQNDAVDR